MVDTSHSMAADDEAPSRMEKAKALARAFLRGLDPSVKVGLVSFGPQAVLVLSPTRDRRSLLEALEGLRPGGTTPLGNGLLQAKRLLRPEGPERDLPQEKPPAAVLLLSDGAANAGQDPLEVAAELSRAGLPVYVRPWGPPGSGEPDRGGALLRARRPPPPPAPGPGHGGRVLEEDFRPLYQALRPHYAWQARPQDLSQALVVLGFLLLAFGAYSELAREGRWP